MHLADKLLNNDPVTIQLLAPGGNPFLTATGEAYSGEKNENQKDKSGGAAPVVRFVRAELYEVNTLSAYIVHIHLCKVAYLTV